MATLTPDDKRGRQHPRLLRCEIINGTGQAGVRYVELGQFKLWEHMMRTRHSIEVRKMRLCLWIGEATYMRNAGPFNHAGQIEQVDQITASVFDPQHHYLFEVQRYVPVEETEMVSDILLSHVPAHIVKQDGFTLDVVNGYCVEREIDASSLDLVLGISGYGERDIAGPDRRMGRHAN